MIQHEIFGVHLNSYRSLCEGIILDQIVWVSGLPCVGKKTLVRKVIEDDPSYAGLFINCSLIATPTSLYLEILKCIADNVYPLRVPEKTITAIEFVRLFKEARQATRDRIEKLIVVFDRFEHLKRTSVVDCLNVLYTGLELSLILITTDDVHTALASIKCGTLKAILLNRSRDVSLCPWTKNDIINFILREPEVKRFEDLYRVYVNNVVNMVYDCSTKNGLEIRSYCIENFDHFLDFYRSKARALLVKQRKLDPDEELTDHVLSEFQADRSLIQNTIAAFLDSFKNMVRNQGEELRPLVSDKSEKRESEKRVLVSTGCLIVAAYIAAHTRPSDDKKNFVKYQKRNLRSKSYGSNRVGRKPFKLERLLQIHKALSNLAKGIPDYDENSLYELPDSVLSDLETFVDLGIITCHGDGLDSSTNYKVSSFLSRDYVKFLAKSDLAMDLDYIFGLD